MKATIVDKVSTNFGRDVQIKNCIEEEGEYFYIVKVQGERGLAMYHSEQLHVSTAEGLKH